MIAPGFWTASRRWSALFLLLWVLLAAGCRGTAEETALIEQLAPRSDARDVEIVQQLEEDGRLFVLFYYTDASGQRWLSTKEFLQTWSGALKAGRRYSSLQLTPSCASPCTTFEATRGRGLLQMTLYGYTTTPGVTAVEISLADGRTLRSPVTNQAFITRWGGPSSGPGDARALHKEIRELHEE